MVSRIIRWRRPPAGRKYNARLVVRRLEGLPVAAGNGDAASPVPEVRMVVEVRWKGHKAGLSSLRRAVRRNRTAAVPEGVDGCVIWDEEFESAVTITGVPSGGGGDPASCPPWELELAVFNDSNKASKNRTFAFGPVSLNLAEYAAAHGESEIIVPLDPQGGSLERPPLLHLTLNLSELRLQTETSDISQKSGNPAPSSPSSGEFQPSEKDDHSVIKAGLRKVKYFTDLVSARKSRKSDQDDEGSDGKACVLSDGADCVYTYDTDSLDDDIDEREPEVDNAAGLTVRKSFSYSSLASVNYVGREFYSRRMDGESEDWVYYSHRKSDAGLPRVNDTAPSGPELPIIQPPKRSILPWRKRKLNLRSLKSKGEPLLKRAYGEEGGDDIDYDRRLLSSSDESSERNRTDSLNQLHVSAFGDDNFVIGNWEYKEILSRDGHMKLSTEVFFASIDQRSERAAGESACTALVAVIADWFQANRDTMPIRSQFDNLIREGSLEWRNLCENPVYRERFPDKHFDLESVLQAKIRPLSVVPFKSFIGFFHPEVTEEDSGFDFLHGAMSFDNIWEELSRVFTSESQCPSDKNQQLYIVSWNDHFFVLRVEDNAYYIIDTLGERLYEGCNQAYILKFNDETTIHRLSPDSGASLNDPDDKNFHRLSPDSGASVKDPADKLDKEQDSGNDEINCELVVKGKEACKEYIKSFLAAIPIRELQADIKKGLMSSAPLHQRLQIEFHYTEASQETVTSSSSPSLPAEPTLELCWPEVPGPDLAIVPVARELPVS